MVHSDLKEEKVSLLCRRTLPSEEETVVEWNLVGHSLPVVAGECADSRACVSHNNTLTISYVHPEDRGLYSCSAYNSQGNTTREVHLEVKVRLLPIYLDIYEFNFRKKYIFK